MAGASVDLQASCTDPDGDAVTHLWSLAGGATSTKQNPGNVVFADPGVYVVSYTCTDSKGLADPTPDTRTITVTAPNRPPDGTITSPATNVSIAPGGTVNFAASCTDPDGDSVTHLWSFGGGAAGSTQQNPGNVVFANAGVFAVTYTCTDSKGLADPTPAARSITVTSATTFVLGGFLSFDKVPSTASGLNYAAVAQRPIRGVQVEVADASDLNNVLAAGVTGADGHYFLSWPTTGPGSVKLVAFARTSSPRVVVQDNTAGKVAYALVSSAIDATATSTVDLKAAIGWSGTSYTNRAAAPFAVLDAAWEAVLAFQAARPSVVFPELHINWSTNNAPVGPQNGETQDQAYAAGHIGTSHWTGTEHYILGKEDVDTDEFDDHVIVHEWGHYFESKLGRSDSPGGQHGTGDIKDARLAFGEGWGNSLSAMIWAPNTIYSDSTGPRQASGFGFDLEDNVTEDPNPGWFSEGSVQSILFDLFDDSGANEAFDTVALGLGPIYDVMTGEQKETSAMTTLFSFIAALKAANPAQAAAIDTLTRYRGVVGVAIADAYGTGETVNGGNSANLPVYRTIATGTPVPVTLLGGSSNAAGQNRYFRFTGDGASHTVSISTPGTDDVDVVVYQKGIAKAWAQGKTGTETTQAFTAAAATEYIVVVTGFASTPSYTTTVTVN